MKAEPKIAIVGAGMAGLACARRLTDAGHSVILLEKSRGLGGRLASRRTEYGPIDHGARFIKPRTSQFQEFLVRSTAKGSAAPWAVRGEAKAACYVGLPSMNGLVKPLAAGIEIRLQSRVTGIARSDRGWQLESEDGALQIGFQHVVFAVPAPQAFDLLGDLRGPFTELDEARMSPCWAYLASFEGRLEGLDDLPEVGDRRIDWLARDSAKPGRKRSDERWILHANAEWSRDRLDLSWEAALAELRDVFASAVGQAPPQPLYEAAHRWRYALTERALGKPFVSDAGGTLFACGDWCLGASAEDAFQSGTAVAEAILG
ncbi:MAG: FAD-dependent oxidoreductase [Nisaea sp.]|uniref:NAD(P)/FAD-dependent oxidoreductase n=1 Tax=Nisaea sp. TaxID=2024842 RepID=UPI001B052718|nr:FAD-dependent oxidoreductase [Nisaea sp.]MBO6559691.1 FAD-dependent oxidoreductase [Nisaea sp.]